MHELKQSAFYPHHVSDRVDLLVGELHGNLSVELYEIVRHQSLSDWLLWFEDAFSEILNYDSLSTTERKIGLKRKAHKANLQHHHACIYLELWRIRLSTNYRQLPPNGTPIHTALAQRELMMLSLTAFNALDQRDFWPFDVPENALKTKWFPFIGE